MDWIQVVFRVTDYLFFMDLISLFLVGYSSDFLRFFARFDNTKKY